MERQAQTKPLSSSELRLSPGPARLVLLLAYEDQVRVFQLVEGARVRVGREPSPDAREDLLLAALPDPNLSRNHAELAVDGDGLWVEDLGSRNGTLVNGQRVPRARIGAGDAVRIGNVRVSVHLTTPPPALRRIVSHETMTQLAAQEVARARHFKRSVGLVLAATGGERRSGAVLERAEAWLRPPDRLSWYGPDTLEVLVPEASRAELMTLCDLLGAAGAERVGGASFPEGASCAESLFEEACRALRVSRAGAPVVLPSPACPRSEGRDPRPVAVSPASRQLLEMVGRVADAAVPVLLVGETGSGKEVAARAIHEASPRRRGPLQVINCGAVPPGLIEATFFGYRRWAFTDARDDRPGLFEIARGGTVFLDEVGDLPLPAQAALLRVLEAKVVRRIGGAEEVPVDVRVLAATNRPLEQMAAAGTFRRDLLYRLNTVVIEVPPLRARAEDIAPLAAQFLAQAAAANGRTVRRISRAALEVLLEHSWPGNVRELRNVIERAVVLSRSDEIVPADLPGTLAERAPSTERAGEAELPRSLRDAVSAYEAQLLVRALRVTGGNTQLAADRLALPHRTLQHKVKSHGIVLDRVPRDPLGSG